MFYKRIVENYLKYLCFLGYLLEFTHTFKKKLQGFIFSSLIIIIAPFVVQFLENLVEFLKENE